MTAVCYEKKHSEQKTNSVPRVLQKYGDSHVGSSRCVTYAGQSRKEKNMAGGEHGKRIRGNFHESGERCPQIIFGKNSCDICVNSPHYSLKANSQTRST